MSDFFGGVHGARFPEVVMNGGPLPGKGGLPAPLHDTADGRINYNSTLLGDLTPYAYGEAGYISSDTQYLNFPHSIPKIVPEVFLPEANGLRGSVSKIALSHSVDDSDVAFVMRLARTGGSCPVLNMRAFDRGRMNVSANAFVNLCTLNYILAGLQASHHPGDNDAWFALLHELDAERWREARNVRLGFADIVHIVHNLITPFGIVRGSEKQGGQDQVGLGPATWPVCFITNMVLDGKERNVVDMWMNMDVDAGTDVVLRLRPMPLPPSDGTYTLNHYYKQVTRQRVRKHAHHGGDGPTHVWQLVPDTFGLDNAPPTRAELAGLPAAFRGDAAGIPSWQHVGYWHIGRTQVMLPKLSAAPYYYDDMAERMRTPVMEMTFQPSWQKIRRPAVHPIPGWGATGAAGGGLGWVPPPAFPPSVASGADVDPVGSSRVVLADGAGGDAWGARRGGAPSGMLAALMDSSDGGGGMVDMEEAGPSGGLGVQPPAAAGPGQPLAAAGPGQPPAAGPGQPPATKRPKK